MINTVSGNKIKLLRRKGIYITNYLELKVACNQSSAIEMYI